MATDTRRSRRGGSRFRMLLYYTGAAGEVPGIWIFPSGGIDSIIQTATEIFTTKCREQANLIFADRRRNFLTMEERGGRRILQVSPKFDASGRRPDAFSIPMRGMRRAMKSYGMQHVDSPPDDVCGAT